MKKLYAIIAILFAVTLVANAAPNTNSHKEATGTFYYTVEPPLMITTNTGSQDLGAVCPNCTVTFDNPRCLQWTVTGGASCNVLVQISNTTPPEAGVTITTATNYNDQDAGWEATWGEHTDGPGGVFHIGTNNLQFQVCAYSISASNTAAAGVGLTDVFTIIADYTSDVAPHL